MNHSHSECNLRRYPSRVQRIVLASPWGVAEPPPPPTDLQQLKGEQALKPVKVRTRSLDPPHPTRTIPTTPSFHSESASRRAYLT
eukprot:1187295-Prorocentrum_minimum.AAC.1